MVDQAFIVASAHRGDATMNASYWRRPWVIILGAVAAVLVLGAGFLSWGVDVLCSLTPPVQTLPADLLQELPQQHVVVAVCCIHDAAVEAFVRLRDFGQPRWTIRHERV